MIAFQTSLQVSPPRHLRRVGDDVVVVGRAEVEVVDVDARIRRHETATVAVRALQHLAVGFRRRLRLVNVAFLASRHRSVACVGDVALKRRRCRCRCE